LDDFSGRRSEVVGDIFGADALPFEEVSPPFAPTDAAE
jgi:hypothetical protein